MVVPPATPLPEPGQAPDPRPAAPPLTGYTVPAGWGSAPKPRTPGTVIAAAVLTYIRGGVGILASVLLVAGASAFAGLDLLWVIIGVGTLAISVLYVVAALLLQLRANRTVLLWLVIIDIAIEVVSIILTFTQRTTGGAAEGAGGNLCSLILPVVILILLRHRNTTDWVEARRG